METWVGEWIPKRPPEHVAVCNHGKGNRRVYPANNGCRFRDDYRLASHGRLIGADTQTAQNVAVILGANRQGCPSF